MRIVKKGTITHTMALPITKALSHPITPEEFARTPEVVGRLTRIRKIQLLAVANAIKTDPYKLGYTALYRRFFPEIVPCLNAINRGRDTGDTMRYFIREISEDERFVDGTLERIVHEKAEEYYEVVKALQLSTTHRVRLHAHGGNTNTAFSVQLVLKDAALVLPRDVAITYSLHVGSPQTKARPAPTRPNEEGLKRLKRELVNAKAVAQAAVDYERALRTEAHAMLLKAEEAATVAVAKRKVAKKMQAKVNTYELRLAAERQARAAAGRHPAGAAIPPEE